MHFVRGFSSNLRGHFPLSHLLSLGEVEAVGRPPHVVAERGLDLPAGGARDDPVVVSDDVCCNRRRRRRRELEQFPDLFADLGQGVGRRPEGQLSGNERTRRREFWPEMTFGRFSASTKLSIACSLATSGIRQSLGEQWPPVCRRFVVGKRVPLKIALQS